MANEYKYQGSDLASRFATRSSAKRADVGYKINGVDVSNYWEKSTGGDQIAYDTGYKSGGTDFRYLFRSSGYTPPTPTPAPTATPTPTPTPAGPTATPTPTPVPTCTQYNVYRDIGYGYVEFYYYDCAGVYQYAYDAYMVSICNGDSWNSGCSWSGIYSVCTYVGSCSGPIPTPTPTPAPTATPYPTDVPTPTPEPTPEPTATPTPTPTPACSKYGVYNDHGVLDFWYYDCNGNYQNAVDIYYVEVCNGDAYNIGCSWPGTYNVCNYMGSCP